MQGIKDIIEEASTLPIEERIAVVGSLLRTLNLPNLEIDTAWIDVARQRLSDLRSKRATSISGDEVFSKIKARFSR